jgi:hypothetical protein
MAKVKVDFTGVETSFRCEEGQQVARLIKLEETESQSGSDMLAATFEVIKGKSKGSKVYDNFVLTEKALWKLKSYLQAVGVKADGKVVIDLDKMVGKVCIIEVFHEEYKNQLRAKISDFLPLAEEEEKPSKGKKSKKVEDDDWDDDWEED